MARHYRELSVRIVSILVDTIERVELARYDAEQDPTAYHLFLTGQKLLRTLDLPSVRKARRAFKASISSYSDFVPAISGLAHTFHIEWLLMARGDNELLAEAEHLARRSLEIDPDDARGYRDLGLCNIYAGRFDESLEAFSHAERRNPQYADLLVDYADALQHSCEASAALEKINRAIELNPLGPDRYWWTAGGANFHLQRYREAIESHVAYAATRAPHSGCSPRRGRCSASGKRRLNTFGRRRRSIPTSVSMAGFRSCRSAIRHLLSTTNRVCEKPASSSRKEGLQHRQPSRCENLDHASRSDRIARRGEPGRSEGCGGFARPHQNPRSSKCSTLQARWSLRVKERCCAFCKGEKHHEYRWEDTGRSGLA